MKTVLVNSDGIQRTIAHDKGDEGLDILLEIEDEYEKRFQSRRGIALLVALAREDYDGLMVAHEITLTRDEVTTLVHCMNHWLATGNLCEAP